ncbi:hypothetical protein ETH_00006530 [Eimeria tenella]|uniref:Uncharacterized protein n=1 Tax=Eimeria tenella TaxID=5802 RepID=U6L4G9_EIMTE|nr:hypothetical protein ETH_00006530 [Eimeria tenella]CDJ45307.1 hypothetical protein ETH_00006530 [Eimeria tenella]|eukprot:XP_013236053.1 hypothetical protein ETH_00006530 [Eimeria tenella]
MCSGFGKMRMFDSKHAAGAPDRECANYACTNCVEDCQEHKKRIGGSIANMQQECQTESAQTGLFVCVDFRALSRDRRLLRSESFWCSIANMQQERQTGVDADEDVCLLG